VTLLTALLCSCGPRYVGDGGEAGESPSGDPGGATIPDEAFPAGDSRGSINETASVASTAGAGLAVTAGDSFTPETEPVIGCAAQSWPEGGTYFEPPPFNEELPFRRQQLLREFSLGELSADGRVVVGYSRDPDTLGNLPLTWTLSAGIAAIPVVTRGRPYPLEASCDGNIVLVRDLFNGIYRVDIRRWQYPLVIHSYGFVGMDPIASSIIDGTGNAHEVGYEIVSYPRLWTAATGPVEYRSLKNTVIRAVAADGTLIGWDTEELFRFDPVNRTRHPIGMAPMGRDDLVVSSSGYAWIHSADRHLDSFLVWREPAQPFSVTCPASCSLVDLSSTGQIALVDMKVGAAATSWIWTESSGFRELGPLLENAGFDLRDRDLQAIAMSDDGRAFTGYSKARNLPRGSDRLFFYAVLPASAYHAP
jgi:hypothetical protein